jgi:hypothetical protein
MPQDGLYRRDSDCGPRAPIAPIIEVVLTHNNRTKRCLALIDSGSPISTITDEARQILQPKKRGQERLSGATDKQSDEYDFYFVDVVFAGTLYEQHPLYYLRTSHQAMLIGRDILNSHAALLDGPKLEFSII